MKTIIKLSIVILLSFSACKESPKQAWQRASNNLREASKMYSTLADSARVDGQARQVIPNAPNDPENEKTLTILLMGYSAAFSSKQCLETADKLETFAQFESPTSEQYSEVVKTMDDLFKSAENSTTNPKLTAVMRPDQRRGFIAAQALVKQANEIVKNNKPSP